MRFYFKKNFNWIDLLAKEDSPLSISAQQKQQLEFTPSLLIDICNIARSGGRVEGIATKWFSFWCSLETTEFIGKDVFNKSRILFWCYSTKIERVDYQNLSRIEFYGVLNFKLDCWEFTSSFNYNQMNAARQVPWE